MRTDFAAGLLRAFSVLCLSALASGQTPASDTAKFAAEPYIVRSVSTVTSMNADGTGTRLQTLTVSIQSDVAVRQFSVVSLMFSSQSEHAEFVRARVTHSDGSVQDTPVEGAIEQPAPVTQQAPLYSDLQTKQLPIKSLRVGDTLEWQMRFTVFHPEVPNQFWGQDTFFTGSVVLNETYELHVPSALHLTTWTNPRAGASFSQSDTDGQHIYRWSHSNFDPTVGPEADARKKTEEKRLATPDEELDALKGKLPAFAWTTFPNWAAVGAWYAGLAADRTTPDAAIKAKVAELTAGKTTDLEKAQAVYNYVSRIRYIGVDFGIGRYQPHSAADVFSNQYGDCKDKHTLLASMLSVLGIHADPVLIGAGIRFNSAVPSPASFNHVISRTSIGGKEVWLDATAEIGIWGALLKPIRDHEALVIPSAAPTIIAQTPADLPYKQFATAAVTGSLDKSLTSESTITFTLHDDDELYIRAALKTVSPGDYGTFVQRMMAGMGFGGTTSSPDIEHLDDPSQPLQFSFHYHRLKESDWGENRITAIFQPIGLPYFTADNPATSAIQLGSPRTESSTVEMQLPEGWHAFALDAVHAHSAFANCDVTFSSKERTIHAERQLTVLKPEVPVKDFKQYQSWYEECGASSVPYIQLIPAPKVTAAATSAEPPAPNLPAGSTVKPPDPKAAELVKQGMESARSGDLDKARSLLDQAAAINSTQPGLWAAYSGVAALLGMKFQATQDMERELSYHPEEVQFYPYVAGAEQANGDAKAALATLRAWVKAAPDSVPAAAALANRLLADKSPAEALQEANSAIDRLKASDADLTGLRIIAANAQVDLGHASEAAAAVAPLLKTASGAVAINDIAYILAEAGTNLPEANAAEAKVIADLEDTTAAWTTSSEPIQLMQQQNNLAADWDTMAWILYRQGKFAEAYAYQSAAIHTTNSKAVRDHLAAIGDKLHSPAATATLHANDQQLRTFPLGPANGRQGVASFILILSEGKVLDSTPDNSGSSSSTPTLTDATQRLKSADLHALFPPNSKVRLVRNGLVNCHRTTCELVLAPLNSR